MDKTSLNEHIEKSLLSVKEHDLISAQIHLDAALSLDFENDVVLGLLKYLAYWKSRKNILDSAESNVEKCDLLLNQWGQFQSFIDRVGLRDEAYLYAYRHYVFGLALNYLSVYNNEAGVKDPEVLHRMGIGLRGIGNYEAAGNFLESANSLKKNDASIMADLADVYALIDETKLAKLLFREAFFLAPFDIRLEWLESEMIRRLIKSTEEEGYEGELLNAWVPVYGQLLGIFSVKRELRALEYGKLLQSIYHLEREILEAADASLLIPQVLNKYFWLIDHYSRIGNEDSRIRSLVLKIKSLSPRIYEMYTS